MPRDLVYKPAAAPSPAEEREKKLPERALNKLGLPQRSRDLGGADPDSSGQQQSDGPPSAPKGDEPNLDNLPPAMAQALAAALGTDQAKPLPAHQAAYFNKDVVATAYVNQRSSTMQALRGATEALDLRKVTLPMAAQPTPNADQLLRLAEQFGVADQPDMGRLLSSLTEDRKGRPLTLEDYQARLRALEQAVADRMLAKERLQACSKAPRVAPQGGDVVDEAAEVVEQVHQAAAGLRRRIKKVLGR
jgi:hypothetical protein